MLNNLLNVGSDLFTNSLNRKNQSKINQQNLNAQKEFAQNSIQWRVNDAKAAGLHPLAALGANGTTYTPSAVSSQYNAPQFNIDFEAKRTQKLQNELLESQIESQKLQNSAFSKSFGQQSNQQNSINQGLVVDAISPIVNTKKLKDKTNVYLGKDKSQLVDDVTSDNTVLGVLSQARQVEKQNPWIFNDSKLDVVDSILNLSPQYVDKKDATLLDRFFYNYVNLHSWVDKIRSWQDKNISKQNQRVNKRNNFLRNLFK